MIKPGLQLGLKQRLTLTPQLRQGLELLQLSALELQQSIGELITNNVMLEASEAQSDDEHTEPDHHETATKSDADGSEPPDLDIPDYATEVWARPRHSDADMDAWRDRTASQQESLRDHLAWQLRMARLSDTDFAIGTALIDSIDDNGYLDAELTDIAANFGPELVVTTSEIQAVLHRIQTFDPLGAGARSLRECLLLQLGSYADATPGKTAARLIIDKHLDTLAEGQRKQLQATLQLSDADMATAEALIQTLDPRPGSSTGAVTTDYIVPDVLVTRSNGRWQCTINPAIAPRLRVNPLYERCLREEHRGDHEQAPLRRQLEEARWLVRSLKMRGDSLLRVASTIIDHQQAYFDFGEEAMKPLGLKRIADLLEMHESTVSRVCANKWMATPRGVLQFRYFFSNAVSNGQTDDHSATAIRAMIRKLIGTEDVTKPLSDSRISAVLKSQGVDVARRTVAKYRESLSIPPSHQRKT